MKSFKELYTQLNESNDYEVWIEKVMSDFTKGMTDDKQEITEKKSFKEKKDANKYVKELIKKYSLIKYSGYLVNWKKMLQIGSNY